MHSGVIGKQLNTALTHLMRLLIRCALCMEKEQLAINIWYCALWSRKYSNYSQTSFIRTTLFRQKIPVQRGIRKIKIRPVATGSIRWKSSLNFFVLLQILFCQENYLLKAIIKTEVETPEKMFCAPPKPLDLGYGSGLSERWKGKQANCRVRRTVNLSKYVDCMWNMNKWNSHSCFCLLADPYT